ncbi:MAG: hypothetical protein RRY34_00470 [Victivallaceae bacterium]
MKIRIHETDFEGNPVECTGEFFIGKTALDIVEGMKMNPFTGSLTPLTFMRQTLDFIGQENFALPTEPETAATAFLQRLTALGFAHYELDEGEISISPEIQTKPIKTLDNK